MDIFIQVFLSISFIRPPFEIRIFIIGKYAKQFGS